MGKLRDKMKADLELRRYRPGTVATYVRCVKNFAAYYRRSPAEMGESEVREFLLALLPTGAAGHKMHVAALKFLYNITLERPEVVVRIPWPRVASKLPDILDGSEVERLLEAVAAIRHRAVLMTAYAAGLRISEACSLAAGVFRSTQPGPPNWATSME